MEKIGQTFGSLGDSSPRCLCGAPLKGSPMFLARKCPVPRSARKMLWLSCGLLAKVLLHRLGWQLEMGLRKALEDRLLLMPASLG